ncbi:flagellar brake protein [Pantoea sp. 1.19]|uniref:flagellar brake protein n=1 Tax=Pantoea sp. 1.19 TaxID=1925589 RepID=UPI000B172896|nr:flagellar brake protein [Pantoea sp. 1.19]
MHPDDNEQYLKRAPLAVLAALRDILRSNAPLRVSYPHGQFISRLLGADPQGVMLDYSSRSDDNQRVLAARQIAIAADTRDARIHVILPRLHPAQFEALPAFQAPLPDRLWAIQRREYFRVSAPLFPAMTCHGRWPDGSPCQLRLQDLSLGGIGTLCPGGLPAELQPGDLLASLTIHLAEFGHFTADAQLVAVSEHRIVDSKNAVRVTPRLSFRFRALDPARTRWLQQAIFALERQAHDKARRFQ